MVAELKRKKTGGGFFFFNAAPRLSDISWIHTKKPSRFVVDINN